MAKTSKRMPAVFTALCEAKAEDVLDFHTHELANTLRAMAKTSKRMPAVFTALCEAKVEDVHGFDAHELRLSLRAWRTQCVTLFTWALSKVACVTAQLPLCGIRWGLVSALGAHNV